MKNLLVLLALLFAACSSSSTEKETDDNNLIILIGECNGVEIDGDELCDGTDLGSQTCETQGFGPGELKCAAGCASFDVSSCGAPESCGDDSLDESEVCDGENFGDQTCESLGYGEGELSCETNCLGVDIRGCGAADTCGNGQLDEGEVCDGQNFGGQSCESLELGEGAISCFENCLGLDTSICNIPLVCEPECPGALTCERGICVGPLDDLILNEVGFNVSGKIQVEGQDPTIGTFCNEGGNDDREIATITFLEKDLGYRAEIPVTCGDNFTYQTRLPVGTYEVRLSRDTYSNLAEINLFRVAYLADAALKIDKDISNKVLNEVGFNVSGKIQVEGQDPTIGTFCNQGGNDDRDIATITFVEQDLGYRAELPVTCGDNFAYQTRLPVGTYEVRLSRDTYSNLAEINLFRVAYLADAALKIDKNITNKNLNEVGFNVSGRIQVEGQAPTMGTFCNQGGNDDRDIATITFIETNLNYRAEIPVTCGDNFGYQTRLPVGTYEVRLRRDTYSNLAEINLFRVDYLADAALKIDKNITNKNLNEVGFNVSGIIQVEGQAPTMGTFCGDGGNDDRDIATITFIEKNLNYRAELPVTCGDNFAYQTRLPVGTYEVRLSRDTYSNLAEINLFRVDYLADAALKIDKNITNKNLNEVGFNVSGKIQVEGQDPTIGTFCNEGGNDDRDIATITFIEKNLNYRAELPVTCGDDFAYQTRLPVGTYEVRLSRDTYSNLAEINLFRVAYLAEAALKIDKNLTNKNLNEVGFNVSGKIQVEGQAPTMGTFCNEGGNDDRDIATITFLEKDLGYRAEIPVTCGDNFVFQTRLPLGVYEVRLSRDTYSNLAEVNLFRVDYLAIHRLAVE